MTRAYAKHHECPTCEYWDGERKPDKNPQYAQYNGYGTCLSPNSNYRGQKVGGNNSRKCWECWKYVRE